MIKTTLKAIIIFLLLFSSVVANVYAERCIPVFVSGRVIACIPLYYDPFWWYKDPTPQPWKEILSSRLKEITDKAEVSDTIKDLEVLAAMSVLAENLSPDLRKSFYSEINFMADEVLPKQFFVQFQNH